MKRLWPFRHFSLKLWSVVLAVLLWMVVAGEETVERGLRVPLELQQFPAGLELQGDAPSLVDVRVRGESSALSRLAPGDVVACSIALRQAGPTALPAESRAGARAIWRAGRSGQSAQRDAPLRGLAVRKCRSFRRSKGPAPGFVIGTSTVVPPQVEVVGPETSVAGVSEALTDPCR
jgi:hypothetical protein